MQYSIRKKLVQTLLPARPANGHKGTFGTLSVVGGCRQYRGAPVLAADAALHSGTGIVRLASIEAVCASAAALLPCCILEPLPESTYGGIAASAAPSILANRQTAILLGCGLGANPETSAFVLDIIGKAPCPVVIDADGLNCLTPFIKNQVLPRLASQTGQPPIITPHIGEMARLVNKTPEEVIANQLQIALEFAKEQRCVVVLKSHSTVVATPEGESYILQGAENSALAKGGSGDVLSGIIAGLLAQGMPPAHAAASGVWLHSTAGAAGAAAYSCSAFSPAQLPSLLAPIWLDLQR